MVDLSGGSGLKRHFVSIRTGFRMSRAGLHLLWAALTVASAFPLLPLQARRALKVRWSRQLLEVLGVRLQFTGAPCGAGLLVANHISWLDIYAINALLPTNFVAKDDVRAWPLIGWLSAQAETIFIERGSHAAVMRTKLKLVEELRRKSCIAVFPEGTTSNGEALLPFHSALFQSAIDAGVEVQPVTVRYLAGDGTASAAAVYIGDTSLWQSMLAIARADSLTAHLDLLPVLDTEGRDRRELAHQARLQIAARMA